MSGSQQRAAWMAEWRRTGQPETWRDLFVRAGPLSNKVMCRICGSRGFPGGFSPNGWQVGCLIGHKYVCETCGTPCNNLGQHRQCRAHHACCTEHTSDTNHRALQRWNSQP